MNRGEDSDEVQVIGGVIEVDNDDFIADDFDVDDVIIDVIVVNDYDIDDDDDDMIDGCVEEDNEAELMGGWAEEDDCDEDADEKEEEEEEEDEEDEEEEIDDRRDQYFVTHMEWVYPFEWLVDGENRHDFRRLVTNQLRLWVGMWERSPAGALVYYRGVPARLQISDRYLYWWFRRVDDEGSQPDYTYVMNREVEERVGLAPRNGGLEEYCWCPDEDDEPER